MMTINEAWLFLGEAWKTTHTAQRILDAPSTAATIYGHTCFGLCHGIRVLYDRVQIDYETKAAMLRIINALPAYDQREAYCWPLTRRGAAQRVEFCLQQAKRSHRVLINQ